jgi:group I intron endonuclease
MKNVIYKIRNVVNQHYYVGSTVDSRKRFWEHRKDLRLGRHVCIRLQRAWDKYGEDCFKFEIVEQLEGRDLLLPAEQKWLDEHYGAEYCYNTSASADTPMRDATPEMRAHLSAKAKAWHEANEHPRLGVHHDEETLMRMSESRKGKHAGTDHYRYGQTVSPEVRAKISAAQKGVPKAPGRKVSPEGMAKIRANIAAGRSHRHWEGRQHSEESRAKMSRPIAATDPAGNVSTYPSITALREVLGLTPTTVNRAVKSGLALTRGKMLGWSFKYVDPA